MPSPNGSHPTRPSRRGGPRPGAGPPKGNLNALKHGENSRQLQQLAIALSLLPDARKALNRLVRRQRHREAQARKVAVKLLANLLRASLQNLEDNQPISGTVTLPPDTDRPAKRKNSRNVNQSPQSRPQSQSNPALPSPSKGEGQGEGTN
jgi:hypothetical protein